MQKGSGSAAGPILITPRLLLRLMVLEDVQAMHAFKSDPTATRLFGEDPHSDLEQTRNWVLEGLEGSKSGRSVVWAITLRSNGQVIGECCLWNIDNASKRAELGYELLRAHWGQGLMNEALTAVLDHGFVEMGLNRIEASPLSFNLPSQRVLVRLGFKQEGMLRKRHLYDGEWHDEMWFGLLGEEWAARSNR
jgi:ribosomal-protein-alanine N-acetyltransferase